MRDRSAPELWLYTEMIRAAYRPNLGLKDRDFPILSGI